MLASSVPQNGLERQAGTELNLKMALKDLIFDITLLALSWCQSDAKISHTQNGVKITSRLQVTHAV
jgi:hypothetical protein